MAKNTGLPCQAAASTRSGLVVPGQTPVHAARASAIPSEVHSGCAGCSFDASTSAAENKGLQSGGERRRCRGVFLRRNHLQVNQPAPGIELHVDHARDCGGRIILSNNSWSQKAVAVTVRIQQVRTLPVPELQHGRTSGKHLVPVRRRLALLLDRSRGNSCRSRIHMRCRRAFPDSRVAPRSRAPGAPTPPESVPDASSRRRCSGSSGRFPRPAPATRRRDTRPRCADAGPWFRPRPPPVAAKAFLPRPMPRPVDRRRAAPPRPPVPLPDDCDGSVSRQRRITFSTMGSRSFTTDDGRLGVRSAPRVQQFRR